MKDRKTELAASIKDKKFTAEEASLTLQKIYAEATIIQKSFGDTVEEIMRSQGFEKKWGEKTILDVPRAVKVTGLSDGVFRTNMHKKDCVVDMACVISMCIGFRLSPILTQRLLQSAGLDFRLDNPDHIAYLFLLEHCKDYTIKECNEILTYLGVDKNRLLGSRPRGENGDPAEYNSRKK